MKIRNGFITNSSSTNFIFIFEGSKKENLFNLIRKHNKKFNINWNEYKDGSYKCNAEDIINCIGECLDTKAEYDQVKIYDIKEFIKEINDRVNYWREEYRDMYRENAPEDLLKIKKVTDSKILDKMDSVLEIQFGDNHGNISGNRIAIAMDYEGREIHLIDSDLIVLTEQRR